MKKISYEHILEFLENNKNFELTQKLGQLHPGDIAEIINDLPSEYRLRLFRLLDHETASDVLPDLNDDIREEILGNIHENRLVKIIDEMETDEATDIISELDDKRSEQVLKKIDKDDSQEIKQLLKYKEDSAGGLMQTEIICLHQDMKRDEMIEYIRENYNDVENIHYVFVIDNEKKLVGILEITKLLLAKSNASAKDLMDNNVISVTADLDQERVADYFRKYDLYVLPVVDAKNHLLGRITVDDIIDVIDEEASEDAYKMVGLESEDRVFTTPLDSVKKRLPWLTLNIFTAFIISSVVGIFEPTIHKLSFLAVLMPIVAGLGGNSGVQTLTVITRGIALGELTIHNSFKAIIRQVTVGIINGIIVGSLAMFVLYLMKGNIVLGAVLGTAMICNMFIAGLMGSLVPIILRALKIDPALASSIIVTLLTDVGGYASFLGLATIVFK